MEELLTATQIIKRLKKEAKIPMDPGYFSRKVSEGWIPYHSKEGSPKKFYYYKEVLKALEDMRDPARDAQREANERKRGKSEKERTIIQLRKYIQENPIQESFTGSELIQRMSGDISVDEVEEACMIAMESNCRLLEACKKVMSFLDTLREYGILRPSSKEDDELINLYIESYFVEESYTEEMIFDYLDCPYIPREPQLPDLPDTIEGFIEDM